ncbi:pentatricopeptide repeat-containing protein At1g08070, chloroplastic-like [Ananas comosus]|uniref:Pentatricopeptide repeat-containing protein At1g08070, chloroplastic-like n=1 Tax=Ananas comosus TaxID=4615 RepID=A0A6P5FF97_ANACO|nr:pentatricopeptide repeat-containing protein At1g08070, chloroplastic-like [Ananas comosus]
MRGGPLHGQVLKLGLDSDLYTETTLISMYAACGDVGGARKVFDKMDQRKNRVVWTSMVSWYTMNGYPKDALLLFAEMELEEGMEGDEVAIASALSACAELKDLEYGKKLHCRIRQSGMKICVVLGTALINLYAKCGEMESAREVFDETPERNIVAWSAVISGYAQNNQGKEALKEFKKMVSDSDHKPNAITVMAVLSACAQEGDLALGKWVHVNVEREGLNHSTGLKNSLIDMCSKCRKIDVACEIFEGMKEKDIVSWNAMINGLALHGLGDKALIYFSLMQKDGIKPDDITFIGVLSACSHGGLSWAVGRSGEVHPGDAHEAGWSSMGWGALLSGSNAYGNVELGEKAAKELLDIEPNNDSVYDFMCFCRTSMLRRSTGKK